MNPMDDSGPLPRADGNALLQQESLTALRSIVQRAGGILIRDERTDDFGVDCSFELVLDNGAVTNFRAQVQLKAIGSAKANQDGSFSLSVEVTNLNYLLNGTSPVYILFNGATKQLYYRWAYDILHSLETQSTKWHEQKTVTIRFSELLDSEAVRAIREQVYRQGRLQRHVREELSRKVREIATFAVTTATGEPLSSQSAELLLNDYGSSLIASGAFDTVQKLLERLSESSRRQSKILVIEGYLAYARGRLFEALGFLNRAFSLKDHLPSADKFFLIHLRLMVQHQLGFLNEGSLIQELQNAVALEEGSAATLLKVELIKRQALATHNLEERQRYVAQLSDLLGEIASDETESEATRLNSELLLAQFRMTDLTFNVIHEHFAKLAREKVGNWAAAIPSVALHDAQEAERTYVSEFERLLARATALRNPVLIADAKRLLAAVLFGRIVAQWQMAMYEGKTVLPEPSQVSKIERLCNESITQFELVDASEGELYAKALLAELKGLIGQSEESDEIWTQIRSKAEALGFVDFIERANAALSGKSIIKQFELGTLKAMNLDRDIVESELTEEELLSQARFMIASFSLPASREANLLDEVRSFKALAQHRLTWCRHIQIHQELAHGKSPETMYLVPPNRIGVCTLLGYKSLIASHDWLAVLNAFKGSYCEKCSKRDPKIR